jgi:hypothetical protein
MRERRPRRRVAAQADQQLPYLALLSAITEPRKMISELRGQRSSKFEVELSS